MQRRRCLQDEETYPILPEFESGSKSLVSDRTISPDLQRWYAKRAKSHTVEVAGASHSVYVSHPKEVADVIESAARAVSK